MIGKWFSLQNSFQVFEPIAIDAVSPDRFTIGMGSTAMIQLAFPVGDSHPGVVAARAWFLIGSGPLHAIYQRSRYLTEASPTPDTINTSVNYLQIIFESPRNGDDVLNLQVQFTDGNVRNFNYDIRVVS